VASRKKPSAVIITGNPKYIKGNQDAKRFYSQLGDFVADQGYRVSFDAGKPRTSPNKADVWIGHSRGADRLRFAPSGTTTIPVGSHREGAINHPRDNVNERDPNQFHYRLTHTMKTQLQDKLASVRSSVRKSVLDTPGAFTKRANLRYLLAALAGAPAVGAVAGMVDSPEHPLKAMLGGGAGGAVGGAVGGAGGAAAMALLQALAKKQINPELLARAGTLGALLGATQGGLEATQTAVGASGSNQEAILAAILQEMQSARSPAPYRPDLLR
jgi:hypothetical protein